LPDKIRLYGDISSKHESDFLFIKGAFGCKNNGEALEKMIEKVLPIVRKEATKLSRKS
jgi:hypothetical protein